MIITVKVLVVKQESDYYKKDAIIYVKIKENVTLREFFVSLIKQSTKMKKAKHFLFLYIGDYLKKSALDQTLENLKFSQDCFCAVEITDEFEEDRLKDRFKVFDDSMIFNVQDLSGQQKQDVESESRRKITADDDPCAINLNDLTETQIRKEKIVYADDFSSSSSSDVESESRRKIELKNKNNWPLLRIITGIVDLLLLLATITTFLLFFLTSLNVPIVALTAPPVLLVFGTILFFGWNKVLPKILPKSWLKKTNLGINPNAKDKEKINNKNKKENIRLEEDKDKGKTTLVNKVK